MGKNESERKKMKIYMLGGDGGAMVLINSWEVRPNLAGLILPTFIRVHYSGQWV